MNSATTKHFWKYFDGLPIRIQNLAADAFERWKTDPGHPGLQFKSVKGF